MVEKEEKELKIILLGESGVGKTSIIYRYYKNTFNSNLPSTFGSTFITKYLEKGNITYKLNIWDTTGQEKYHSVTKLFIHGSHIAILVYAINNIDSFQKLDYWYKTIKENCDDNVILAIVGSKYDLFYNNEDENAVFVSEEEGEKYAKEKKAFFKLVTAKEDKKGIDSLFDELINEYKAKDITKKDDYKESNSVKIGKKKNIKNVNKGGCC